jgi:hypothetical protein
MKRLFKDNTFNIGFWCGLIIFAASNFLSFVSAVHRYDTRLIKLSTGGYEWGFPFTMFKIFIGYPGGEEFYWLSVIANISTALVCSFLIGLAFRFVWSKPGNSRLRSN